MIDVLAQLLHSCAPQSSSDLFAPAMTAIGCLTPLPWLAQVLSLDNVDRVARTFAAADAALPIPLLGVIAEPAVFLLLAISTLVTLATVLAMLLWTVALGAATIGLLLVVGLVTAAADPVLALIAVLRGLLGQLWT